MQPNAIIDGPDQEGVVVMGKKQNISSAELSGFCSQVALILSAGLPLYDGMETLAGAAKNSPVADLYEEASKVVNETGSLYQAMQADARWPKYMTEMVGIGERSGQLESIMRGLEKYYAREDRINSAVFSAVTYPLSLGIMLVVIVLILLWKVLPMFRRVLDSMGMGLSESGSTLMRVGGFVGWVVMGLVLIAVIVVIGLMILLRTNKREQVLAFIQQRIPMIAKTNRKLNASRIAGVLSMLLSSGFPVDEALEMTEKVVGDRDASKKVQQVRKQMDDGKSLADSISDVKIFNELHNRMLKMGSAAGKEDQVLNKLSVLYEEEVEDDITRMIAIIEPTLVALLATVIGAVILSVMLPMAGILSNL